jgi:hypothetical protein
MYKIITLKISLFNGCTPIILRLTKGTCGSVDGRGVTLKAGI